MFKNEKKYYAVYLPKSECIDMCVFDCAEGERLLEAAAEASAPPEACDAFLDHVGYCLVCNPDPDERGDIDVLRLDLLYSKKPIKQQKKTERSRSL